MLCFLLFFGITTALHTTKVEASYCNSGELKITFLYVGQGDSMLLQSEGKTMLVDAGKNENGSAVVQCLKENDIDYLDYVVITHDHADHIGGFNHVFKSVKVGKIFRTSERYNIEANCSTVNQMIDNLYVPVEVPTPGETLSFGSATIQFIAPNRNNYSSYNDYSIVMRVVNGQNSFLLAGDAEATSEAEMLKSGFTLKSDVLKVGHHSALTSSTQAFLDAVDPTVSVISCDSAGEAGFPRLGTIDKLTKTNIYRTDYSGNITMVSDGTHITTEDVEPYFYANSDFDATTGEITRTIEEESGVLGKIAVESGYSEMHLDNISDDEDYGLVITEPLKLKFTADSGVYKLDSIEYALSDAGDSVDIDDMDWNDTKNGEITLNDDFSGCIYVKYENQLGNIVVRKTTGFTLDCKAPESTKVTSNVTGLKLEAPTAANTYTAYSTTYPTIKFSCKYGISGKGCIEYMLVKRGEAFIPEDEWIEGTSVTLKDNFIGRIYVRFTDGAGNVKILKTTGFKWIKSVPINTAVKSISESVGLINFSAKSPNTAALTAGERTLAFSADFGYGGKKSIQYQLVKKGSVYKSAGSWVSGSKVTLKKGFVGTVYVKFVDKANHSVVKKTNLLHVKA